MNGVIGATPENTAAMVEAEFGLSNVGKSRYHDLARDFLQGLRTPTQPAALQLLERLQGEADQSEAKRVAAVHAKADQTAASWREFQDRRVALSETPAGFRDLRVRDELSGQLLKLRIPSDWII